MSPVSRKKELMRALDRARTRRFFATSVEEIENLTAEIDKLVAELKTLPKGGKS